MHRAHRTASTAALLVAALVGALTACSTSTGTESLTGRADRVATAAQVRADHDVFGIDNLMPTLPGGTIWTSLWSTPRTFVGIDPGDSWFDADHGSATYQVEDGKLYISGNIPRMYVHDPAMRRQWRDVEATMYFERISDTDIPYAGMTIVARSNHLDTESGRHECDTRGYGARMRYDGHVDFEKETAYPVNAAIANRTYWAGDLPRYRWIGVKFLVYDAMDGVHLELWVDLTDGRDGGRWQRIDQAVDDGHLFGSEACARGIDPQMALTNAPARTGSESGKPNLSVYFRSDGVGQDGLVYKWGSVREVKVSAGGAGGSG